MRKAEMTLAWLEKAFVVVTLMLSTGALLPLLSLGPNTVLDKGDTTPVIQLTWLLIYAITASVVLLRWRRALWYAMLDKLLLALAIWALISVVWSIAPNVTFRKSVALLGTTMFGCYIAQRYSLREVVRLMAWALGIAAVLSIAFALVIPEYGIMHEMHAGSWRGIYRHKNHLGRYMSVGALVFLLVHLEYRRIVPAIGLVVCLGLVILSGSVAALVMTGAGCVAYAYVKYVRSDTRLVIPFAIATIIIVAVGATWVSSNYAVILEWLGRDATLTGRTSLWVVVVESLLQKVWLGYGYGAFWRGWEGVSGDIWQMVGWQPPHSHNGYLDLGVNVGMVGVTMFAMTVIRALSKSITYARATNSAVGLMPLVFIVFALSYNVGESVLLQHNNLFWIIYVMVSLKVAAGPDREIYGIQNNHVRRPTLQPCIPEFTEEQADDRQWVPCSSTRL